MFFGFPIFVTLFAFALVIFVHELGHYLVGRWCGISATTFSIGFGTKIYGFYDKNNTEWKICLIPLGGYVKFVTKSDIDKSFEDTFDKGNSKKEQFNYSSAFESASLVKRTLTVLAGPFANFLLAIAFFAFSVSLTGVTSNEPVIGSVVKIPDKKNVFEIGDLIVSVNGNPVKTFTEVYQIVDKADNSNDLKFVVKRGQEKIEVFSPYVFQPIVLGVELFSPAMKAGIKEGDVFLEVNQVKLSSFADLKIIVGESIGQDILVKFWRDGNIQEVFIKPEMRPTETMTGDIEEKMRIGIRGGSIFSPKRNSPSVFQSAVIGVEMTIYVIRTSLIAVARMIDSSISPKHLSGPIGIAKALSHSVNEGLVPFLSLLASISAGLCLVNLFPIPILDGGHLVMFMFEAIFKRPPSVHFTKNLMGLGLLILFVIMAFATFNDIMR